MAREIKFRVWDYALKRFVDTGEIIISNYGDTRVSVHPNEIHYGDIAEYEHDTANGRFLVSQYTGQKDKNGVEIYEGDIVEMITPNIFKKYKTKLYKISWDRFKYVARAIDGEFKKVYPKNFDNIEATQCQISGNIYENPEVLNQ